MSIAGGGGEGGGGLAAVFFSQGKTEVGDGAVDGCGGAEDEVFDVVGGEEGKEGDESGDVVSVVF